MPRKITYFLLIAFVVYLITLDPSRTGAQANDFLGWLGGGFDSAMEFLDEAIQTDSSSDGQTPVTPDPDVTPLPIATPTPTPDITAASG